MDLRQLRTFVTVAEQGTVSRASVHLGIAQPALSRQISDLEAELGIRLFDRIRRRLSLTDYGERLLGECRAIVHAADGLTERARLLQSADSGVLRIAATPQMIEGVFSKFLHQYAAHFPNVQLRLIEAVGTQAFPMLERGELHLVINYLQTVQTEKHEFESLPLPPLEFLAASHQSVRLSTGGDIEIAKLVHHRLLLLDPSFGVRATFDAACRLAGLSPQVFFESRAPHTLLALAEAGHGVAVVPSVQPTNRYRLRIARITYRRRPLRGLLTVLRHRRRVLPKYAEDFCNILQAYMRDVFPISRPTIQQEYRETGALE